jgi:hypothetical protein
MKNVYEDNERRQALLARVAKLLALAEGSSYPEESYSALAAARRLMADEGRRRV